MRIHLSWPATLRSVFIGTAVAALTFPPLVSAQTLVPQIPTDPLPDPGSLCTSVEEANGNFDRFDPCCYPNGSPFRSEYCPTKVQDPFDVAENFVYNQIRNVLNALNFPQIIGFLPGDPTDFVAGQLADFVVDQGRDWLLRTASGSQGSGPLSLTIPDVYARLSGDEYLSAAIFTSTASISRDPQFRVVAGEGYKLPYPASPSVRLACENSGGEHKDRDFDRGVLAGGSVVGGHSTFVTQAGVPTEIAAIRPSWTSRQIWDFHWSWWFGDASMVPISDKDNSYTVHTWSNIGAYTLAFVMLKDDPMFTFGADGNFISGLDFRFGIDNSSDKLLPDACNYATMDVRANQRPTARIIAGPTNLPYQYRFTAFTSGDPDGNPLAYLWRLSDGATTRAVTFYKMYPSTAQFPLTETVELTVSDGAKMHTITQTVIVAPSNCPVGPGFPPIAGGICDT